MCSATGQFFANRKPKTANKVAHDTNRAARLWGVGAELVRMTPEAHSSTGGTAQHQSRHVPWIKFDGRGPPAP